MKRSFTTPFITFILLCTFVFTQVALPLTASAAPLNYDNPNANGNNPYRFKAADAINGQMLTQVVGCAVDINKIADAAIKLVKKIVNHIAGGPVETNDKGAQDQLTELQKQQLRRERREACFNGIAIQLAKNQLASFTKYTMNWVTTGFNGNPFFVRNVNQFMTSIQKEIIEKENNIFKQPKKTMEFCTQWPDAGMYAAECSGLEDIDGRPLWCTPYEENNYTVDEGNNDMCLNLVERSLEPDYPFGRDFSLSQIEGFKVIQNPEEALKSDLKNYLKPGATTESFGRDFSQGGWDGWLALTQHPQNNPLGFAIEATEVTVRKQNTAITETKDEIRDGGGYLSQKTCADPSDYNPQSSDPAKKECKTWQVVTPGSTIKDKISTYINSPERQLELVKTINDALNSLFSALLMKFQTEGLASLGTQVSNGLVSVSGGIGSNTIIDSNGNIVPVSSGSGGGTGGSISSTGFDLTHDLGNQYANARDDGTWNASSNTPALRPNFGIQNQFYTVGTSGNTRLFDGNYVWQKGDKAFFDGTTWKVGIPKYVISKKGVLQIQHDYINKLQDAIGLANDVVPAIARLDYCIPGPNPTWQTNTLDAQSAFLSTNVITDDLQGLFDEYNQKIQTMYNTMQTPGTSDYLAMSTAGLNLTKDMDSYNQAIDQKTQEYQGDISAIENNINKLDVIRKRVNEIITSAQQRRDTKRVQDGKTKVSAMCIATEKVTYIEGDVLK